MAGSVRVRYGWDRPAPPSWRQFVAWMLVAPIGVLGLLAAFTPLVVITTPLAALLVLLVISRIGLNASLLGSVSGVGLGPLIVAMVTLLNNGSSVLPWLLVGLVLVGGGILGYVTVTQG